MTAKRTASWHMVDTDSWVVHLMLNGLDLCTYHSNDFDDVQQVVDDWMSSGSLKKVVDDWTSDGFHPDDL